MLTDLNWLEAGMPYPPLPEKERIQRYEDHERLFLTQHERVWEGLFREMARRLRKPDKEVRTILNYHQLLSKKTADFVCGEPPVIETDGDTDSLVRMLAKQGFKTRLYEGIIDVTRYGNGVLKIVGRNLTQVDPQYWFPVVDPSDLKNVVTHVVAYPISPNSSGDMTELYAEIHYPGLIETRTYGFDAKRKEIGSLRTHNRVKTGLDDFAIQVLTNVTHSGSLYGLDDYSLINSLVAKIMWRLHCADTVLDKHSEPSMSGPSSALTWDERLKTYYLDLGNYFRREHRDDPDPQYITWDGNLEANWKELEMLIQQLYILTEMGQAFLEGGGGGEAQSGTALKLRLVSPRIKAARLTNLNTDTVKTLIWLLAKVNGMNLNYDALGIKWRDGLPNDEVEEIQTLVTATGGPIMSKFTALKQRGLSDDEIEDELEQMRVERAAEAPMGLSLFDLGERPPVEEEDNES